MRTEVSTFEIRVFENAKSDFSKFEFSMYRLSNFELLVIVYFRISNDKSSNFRISKSEICVWDQSNFPFRTSNVRNLQILLFEIRVCDLSTFETRTVNFHALFSELRICKFQIWSSKLRSFEFWISEFEFSIFEIRTSPSSRGAKRQKERIHKGLK